MSQRLPRIAYITAGAAGMYCGSCMRDNALVAALHRLGVDATLVPTYTPIRTDEPPETIDRVFFGGINVYLHQRVPLLSHLPRWLTGWLDRPGILHWATSRGIETDPRQLGALTLSMLQGEKGRQRQEVEQLVGWLADELTPDLVNFTNLLIAGCVPVLRRRLKAPLVATLQGDDVFLDQLVEPYRSRAMAEVRRLASLFDGFIAFSRDYAAFAAEYFGIPADKIHLVPLGLRTEDFAAIGNGGDGEPAAPDAAATRPPTVGYLARIDPLKGFHVLVDAFLALKKMPGMENARLHAAGWLGRSCKTYAEQQFDKLRRAGVGDDFHYAGSVDRAGKLAFLQGIDVLSVPATCREPKGLYVLEALAAGVPVVQPAHGAFPELIESTGGGCLVPPGDTAALAAALASLLADPARRQALGQAGRQAVHAARTAEAMARATLAVYQRLFDASPIASAARPTG